MSSRSPRLRTVTGLPGFEPGFKFHRRWARYDKIEVSFDLGGVLQGEHSEIHEQFDRIAESSHILKKDSNSRMPALNINDNDHWIFGGQAKVYTNHSGQTRIRVYLTVNPTRYFANNPPGRRVQPNNEYYDLQAHGPSRRTVYAEILDRNDNLIIHSRLPEAYNTLWEEILNDLLMKAAGLIEHEIETYAEDGYFSFFQEPTEWAVRSVEVYWEFHADNAPVTVIDFGKYASTYFRRHRERMHHSMTDYDGVFTSYIFDTAHKNVKLALYAKTEDRIRIECRFSVSPKILFNKHGFNDENYPRNDIRNLSRMISDVVAKAQSAAAPLKNACEDYKPSKPNTLSQAISSLAALSYMAGHNQTLTQKIIRTLLISGRVAETTDPKYNDALTRMKERGLLKDYRKRPNQPREYSPVSFLKTLIDKFR